MKLQSFPQLMTTTLLLSLASPTMIKAANIYTVNFSGVSDSGNGGPYNINGGFTWDNSVVGASSNPADVAWNDPGISNFTIAVTGGASPFTFNESTIFGSRPFSTSPSLANDATFDLTSSELIINNNAEFIDNNGNGRLCLGNNSSFCNANTIFAISLGSGIYGGGGYNAPNFFGIGYSVTSTVTVKSDEPESIPESSNILGLILVGAGFIFTGIKCKKNKE